MTPAERVRDLAAEANAYLRRDAERDILLPADGAPPWFTALCRDAHGGMLPDDWRYEFIRDALSALEDGAGEDRLDLDALYPYTADRLRWLASHLDRPGYCDEAAEDAGGAPADVQTFVAWGMDWELKEMFALVRVALAEAAAEGTTNR